METKHDHDLITGLAPNLGEVHHHHHAPPVAEQGHGSTFNCHFETNPSAFGNTPVSPSSLSSPRSPNPFLLPSDATFNTGNRGMMMGDQTHHSSSTVEVFSPHLPFEPFADESPHGNPFQWPNNEDPFVATNVEPHDGFPVINHGHHQSMGSSSSHLEPTFKVQSYTDTTHHQQYTYHETVPTNVESHHNAFSAIEQGHHLQGMASSTNLEIPFPTTFEPSSQSQEPPQVLVHASSEDETVPFTNVESHSAFPVIEQGHHQSMSSTNLEAPFENSHMKEHPSGGDVPSSSMPNQGQNSAGPGFEGIETQNPPAVQVMKRSEDPSDASEYIFPSHVFDRNNANATGEQWSATSNESLFSIYMGNMSFSSDLACFTKSNDLDKNTDISMPDPPTNASTSHEPPAQVSKFNNISQRTAELHEESRIMTEAKAAETMREVIMETSQTTKSDDDKEGNGSSNSNSHRQSDGSAKSYAFQLSSGRDKKTSSGGDEEKQTQQQQSEKQQEKANDAADPASKANTNAAPNKRLSCFPCCTFC